MFKKYPSIGQFRNIIRYVGKHFMKPPVIPYKGTVKIHGTNAAIGVLKDGTLYYQSRNNIITPEDDNAGFATYMHSIRDRLKAWLHNPEEDVIVYGEWCGGNIQKGIGVNGLDKMFVIFSHENVDMHQMPSGMRLYDINKFGSWVVAIDFSNPESHVAMLTELTEKVEAECPVARAFHKEGIGEGIVWKPIDPDWAEIPELTFKVKGEKHAVSKVKTLVALTPQEIDQQNKVTDFIQYCVTEQRVQQAIQETGAIDQSHTGLVIKWVISDCFKEESDVMGNAGITPKEFGKAAPKKIKGLFFEAVGL